MTEKEKTSKPRSQTAAQSTTRARRKMAESVEEPNEQTSADSSGQLKARANWQMEEFALEPRDQQLIKDLQTHLENLYGERRNRSRICEQAVTMDYW